MTQAVEDFPYSTHLDIKFAPLDIVDLPALVAALPHRPRAPERTVILMVEGAGIVPTGDA